MLYTIGYEKKSVEEFVDCLKSYDIDTLVDVREIPISRKKGFSKTLLSEFLEKSGIEYIHIKELGSPRDLRHKLYTDGDYQYFFKEYSKYIKSNKKIVQELYQKLLKKISCLMCYEKQPEQCHRSIVAQEIKKVNGNSLVVKHI